MQAKVRTKEERLAIIRMVFLFLLAVGPVFVAICFFCRGLNFVSISEDLTYPVLLFMMTGLCFLYHAMEAYLALDKGEESPQSLFPFPYGNHRKTAFISFFVSAACLIFSLVVLILSFQSAGTLGMKDFTLMAIIALALPFLTRSGLILFFARKNMALKTYLAFASLQLIILGLLVASLILVGKGKLDYSAFCLSVVVGLDVECLLGSKDEEAPTSSTVED